MLYRYGVLVALAMVPNYEYSRQSPVRRLSKVPFGGGIESTLPCPTEGCPCMFGRAIGTEIIVKNRQNTYKGKNNFEEYKY